MSFGLSTDQLLLKEGYLYIGAVTSPETIGVGADGDPETHFVGQYLGYFKQGTTKINMTREYAEALSGTPAIILRKDLTRKQFSIESSLFQFNVDTLALIQGLKSEAYSGGGWTGTIAKIGSDEPTPSYYAYLLKTALVDGTEFNVMMYRGRITSEDVSIELSGTEHASSMLKAEAFPDEDNFTLTGDDAQEHYGVIWIPTATSAS